MLRLVLARDVADGVWSELRCWDVRELRALLDENDGTMGARLRATVTALRHLNVWLLEEGEAFSVWFQQS